MENINQERKKNGQNPLTDKEIAENYSKANIKSFESFTSNSDSDTTVIEEVPSEAIKTPVLLSLRTPITHKFGDVKNNTLIEHEYVITNVLDVSIKLKNVKPGCSCTASEVELNKVLEPGDVTIVKLKYETSGAGKFTKSAYVYFENEDGHEINPVLLIMQGNIVNK